MLDILWLAAAASTAVNFFQVHRINWYCFIYSGWTKLSHTCNTIETSMSFGLLNATIRECPLVPPHRLSFWRSGVGDGLMTSVRCTLYSDDPYRHGAHPGADVPAEGRVCVEAERGRRRAARRFYPICCGCVFHEGVSGTVRLGVSSARRCIRLSTLSSYVWSFSSSALQLRLLVCNLCNGASITLLLLMLAKTIDIRVCFSNNDL